MPSLRSYRIGCDLQKARASSTVATPSGKGNSTSLRSARHTVPSPILVVVKSNNSGASRMSMLARPFHGFRGSGELKDAKVAFP